MKNKKLFIQIFICAVMVSIVFAIPSCTSYHNDDNPVEYPDPEPPPTPEIPPVINNEKYEKALHEPNCYMVIPGNSVDIPILKAYAIWDIYSANLGTTDFSSLTPQPILLWQDDPELITSVGLISNQGEDSRIVVATATGKTGNAIIGVKIGETIRWSWHIWVTRYNPDTEAYGKVYPFDNNGDGITDYAWMDRNLGALSDGTLFTKIDSLAACGLLYQWGRKDPFPGDSKFRNTNKTDYDYYDSKAIYDANGTLLTEGSKEGGTGIKTIENNLRILC